MAVGSPRSPKAHPAHKQERVAGAGGVIWGAMAGLSVDSTSGPSVWARAVMKATIFTALRLFF